MKVELMVDGKRIVPVFERRTGKKSGKTYFQGIVELKDVMIITRVIQKPKTASEKSEKVTEIVF